MPGEGYRHKKTCTMRRERRVFNLFGEMVSCPLMLIGSCVPNSMPKYHVRGLFFSFLVLFWHHNVAAIMVACFCDLDGWVICICT